LHEKGLGNSEHTTLLLNCCRLFIDNLLVRILFIIVMIRWTGLAPWEFEFPFSRRCTRRGWATQSTPRSFSTATPSSRTLVHPSSSLFLSSLELRDTKVYEPQIRARLETPQPQTPNLQNLNPEPQSLNTKPQTIDTNLTPQPQTPNRASTLNREPKPSNLKLSLRPKPQTQPQGPWTSTGRVLY